jgi:hypothetical protein
MNRKRFVPVGENLEGRQLLSTFVRTSVGLVNTEVPLATLQQRTQRIDRLPNFMRTIDPKATVPAAPYVAILQDNLRLLLGTMHASSRDGIVAMNLTLRGLVKQQTTSPAQAAQLNDTFGKILLSGGANGSIVTSMQQAMNDLTRVTTASAANNSSLVANEYALVLQLALAVGKPLPAPGVPRLAPGDDSPPKNDHRTTNPQPALVGRYEANTWMQIVDANTLQILGGAPVANNGQYSARFAGPLAPGTYNIRLRAISPQGAQSLLSRPFKLTIVQATPKGPMGHSK